MFVDMIYAIVTFPEIYPILAVLLFVTLMCIVALLVLLGPTVDKRERK